MLIIYSLMRKIPVPINRSIFIDSSKFEEIKRWNATGIIDGVTTNQMIMLKDGMKPRDFETVVKKICKEMKGKPVSIELTNSVVSSKIMIQEAVRLNTIAENIVIKVPLIPETTKSLEVIHELIKRNIAVNITAMMTFEQMVTAILAARYAKKTSFVSFFWGRSIEDQANYRSKVDFIHNYPKVGLGSEINTYPKNIVNETVKFLEKGYYKNPKIIVGSIRSASMVGEAFAAGSHIVTVTPDILIALLFSQRTKETIAEFDEAWKKLQML